MFRTGRYDSTLLKNSLEFRAQCAFEPLQSYIKRASRHDVGFYPDDASLLVLTLFIGTALKAGHRVIVVATGSHRNSLLPRLETAWILAPLF